MLRKFFRKVVTPPLVILAAMIMFFEEWLWDHVARFMARLGRLPVVHRLERWLSTLSPYAALSILVLPGLLLFPIKLAALYFIAKGKAILGLCVIIAAKVLGTAIVARMFAICHRALMSIGWLKRVCDSVLRIKARLYTYIKSMAAWQMAVRFKNALRRKIASMGSKGALSRRWTAVKRWLRKGRRIEPADATISASSPDN